MLKVLFGPKYQNFTQVKNITQTVKAMFQRNNGTINENQRAKLIWVMHCDEIYFFRTTATATDLHKNTVPKASLESIHDLIGSNIALDLQDMQYQIF